MGHKLHYTSEEEEIVLQAPMKLGKRARRTMCRKEKVDYEDAWMQHDVEKHDIEDMNTARRSLLTEFMNLGEAKRLTILAMYHANDIPLPIVDMVLQKLWWCMEFPAQKKQKTNKKVLVIVSFFLVI